MPYPQSTPSASVNSCHSHTSLSKEFLAHCERGKSTTMQGYTHMCTVLVSLESHSWFTTSVSKSAAGEPVWGYPRVFNLIRKTLWVCECALFVVCMQLSPLPFSLLWLTVPLFPSVWVQAAVAFSVFFFFKQQTQCAPPWTICHIISGADLQWCCWVNCFVVSASLMSTWPLEGPCTSRSSVVCAVWWHILTHTAHSWPKTITDSGMVVSKEKNTMDISGISLSSHASSQQGV